MMGPLSTAILAGCLQALRWLLWLTALLVLILVAAQAWRAEEIARPLANVIIALGLVAAGWGSEYIARVILRRARR
jgi:hypothetical protein